MVKPSESAKTLQSLGSDLFDLVHQFKGCQEVTNMNSYKLLVRVLNEQCNVNDSGASTPVEVKKSKDVSSDSLQNPSDPDATYSSHKGQGYHVQIMETYTVTEDKELKAETLNLITYVEVEKACQSDTQALIPAIESVKSLGLCPKKITVDSLYGSYDNCETAKEMGVTVISPVISNAEKGSINLKDFQFSGDGHVLKCPKGNEPVLKKINARSFTQCFSFETCSQCTVKEQCIVRRGKRYYYFRYEDKAMRLAMRKARENTAEFKNEYRWRAGVEATMSAYDRRTGVKRLRVRGFEAVRFCAVLKAIGINLFRATALRKKAKPNNRANQGGSPRLNMSYFVFKELFWHFGVTLKIIFSIKFRVRGLHLLSL